MLAIALAWATTSFFPVACRRGEPDGAGTQGAQRVISQTVVSDEILWNLGPEARGRVLAVSSLADDPNYSDIANRWEREVPRMRGTSESLLASNPDLVVIATFTAPETQAVLRAQNIRLRVLDGFRGFADYRSHTRNIAADLGIPQQAATYLKTFDLQLADLRSRVLPRDKPLTVVSWHAGMTAGSDTSFDALAGTLGLQNLPAAQGRSGHFAVTGEQVVAWDPEVLVTACLPTPPGDNRNGCLRAQVELAAAPGIAATRAARHDGIVAIPGHMLFSSGSGMLDAANSMHIQLIERKLLRGVTP